MVNPAVTFRVPVNDAAEDIVCELIAPDVMVLEPAFSAPLNIVAPRVEGPAVKLVVNRLVVEARVEKKFVDVALVVVPNVFVRAKMVEEAFTNIPRVVVGARYVAPAVPCTDQSPNWVFQ